MSCHKDTSYSVSGNRYETFAITSVFPIGCSNFVKQISGSNFVTNKTAWSTSVSTNKINALCCSSAAANNDLTIDGPTTQKYIPIAVSDVATSGKNNLFLLHGQLF